MNKRQNRSVFIAVLLCLSLLLCQQAALADGYTTSLSTYQQSGEPWAEETAITIFDVSYAGDGGQVTVLSDNGDAVFAPGTDGSIIYTVDNDGSADIAYNMWIEAVVSPADLQLPLVATVKNSAGEYLLGAEGDAADIMKLNEVSDSAHMLAAGSKEVYTLKWAWPFERGTTKEEIAAYDRLDTAFGKRANSGEKLELVVIIHVEAEADELSSLTVTKQVAGNTLILGAGRAYAFAVTATLPDGTPLTGELPTVNQNGAEGTVNFVDGRAAFTLTNGGSLTINQMIPGTTYAVTETPVMATTTTATGAAGTLDAEGATAAFINTIRTGSLQVNKQVALLNGATDPQGQYAFTVNVTNPDGTALAGTLPTVNEAGVAGTITFTAGAANFTLGDGQSLRINALLDGSAYTVTEAEYENVIATSTNAAGNIVPGAPVQVQFVNTIEQKFGSLMVSKTVVVPEGAKALTDTFGFKVTAHTADGKPVNGRFETVDASGKAGSVLFTAGQAAFQLKDGETLTIKNLKAGTAYVVTEEEAAGMETTFTGANGLIEADATANAAFTNSVIPVETGSLTLSKTVETTGDLQIPATRFELGIALTDAYGLPVTAVFDAVDQNGTASKVSVVNGKATVRLGHGESLTLQGIPVDTRYTVTEKETPGVTAAVTAHSGAITEEGATAAFVNTISQAYTRLTVKKSWNDENDRDELRTNEITVALQANGETIQTFTLNEANNWSVDTDELPRFAPDGRNIVYSIIEQNVPRGYTATYSADGTVINVTNRHRPDHFRITVIEFEDEEVPLAAGYNMNEGDCFN